MRTLTNILWAVYLLLAMFFYKFLAMQFGLPTIVAGQWYILSGLIVYLVAVASLPCIAINLVTHYEGDGDSSSDMKVSIYNYLGDKKISIIWQLIAYTMSVIMFQYSQYIASIAVLVIAVNITTFRMLHNTVVNKAQIEVLKESAKLRK